MHVEQKYHKDSIKDSHILVSCFEKAEGTARRCKQRIPFTVRDPKILGFIPGVIHFHGMQSLVLREQREAIQESDENKTLENFLTNLKELQSYCPELK